MRKLFSILAGIVTIAIVLAIAKFSRVTRLCPAEGGGISIMKSIELLPGSEIGIKSDVTTATTDDVNEISDVTTATTNENEISEITTEDVTDDDTWWYNASEEDIQIVGDVIFEEMGIYLKDPDAEKVAKAVGSVILWRTRAGGYYPPTVKEVVYQNAGKKGQQYASRTLRHIGHTDAPDEVYKWAEEILRDGPIGPSNLVFQDNLPHGDAVWWKYKDLYFCTSDHL